MENFLENEMSQLLTHGSDLLANIPIYIYFIQETQTQGEHLNGFQILFSYFISPHTKKNYLFAFIICDALSTECLCHFGVENFFKLKNFISDLEKTPEDTDVQYTNISP